MVILQKASDKSKITLDKSSGEIVATVRWIDNGDARSDNDDLDLRAGILFPSGKMSIVHCSNLGSLQDKPYVLHTGDVKTASKENPGEETIKVSANIAITYEGSVAIVFSVYSAIANGPVAIASLKPIMRLQYKDQIIDCALDFTKDPKALKQYVYTYVVGVVTIRGNEVEITPGGIVSEPGSEATPWLEWDKSGNPRITMDGPAVMKGGGKLLAGLINIGNKKKYEVEKNVSSKQVSLSEKQAKKIEELKKAHEQGFLSSDDLESKIKKITQC